MALTVPRLEVPLRAWKRVREPPLLAEPLFRLSDYLLVRRPQGIYQAFDKSHKLEELA